MVENNNIEAELLEMIMEYDAGRGLTPNELAQNIDSLDFVSLLLDIESRFNIVVDFNNITQKELDSIEKIKLFIEKHKIL
ncbi:hypothetical protein [Paenibacillus pabuli]|uniref:hypothetical protein n=1 Tax=Paenibacillus pabuli TaxID=1472 RepID=UPI003CE9CC3F